ncbi:MAG: enoyl-CoA hydratase/isomerase family protein [Candidatus Aenigmatarchaeota archaeon]|nr:MAG: enoyl-CoA hydratase/isomerase family protein [Candidatus Aenigmarchaeota archaeon]
MGDNVLVSESDGVTTITFASPSNRIAAGLLIELRDALNKAQGSVIVLAAKENFSLGYDTDELFHADKQGFYDISTLGQEVCSLLENSNKVSLAVLTGYSLGPGLELALACDFRIAADTAIFGFPEVRIGLSTAFGTTKRLPGLLGSSKGKKLLVSGSLLHAEEAQWLGLVDEVVQNPMERAAKMASSLIRAPPAVRDIKRLVAGASVTEERNAFAACCTDDTKARIRNAMKQPAKA